MPENHIVEISEKLGKLSGLLEASLEGQEKINTSVTSLLSKHSGQIDELHGAKNKLWGAAFAISMFGSGLTTAITKFFGGGH